MVKIHLKSQPRDVVGKKVKKFRKQGLLPAVLYGHNIKSSNIWVNSLDFVKVLSQSGENTLIELETENGKKVNVLVYDVQKDPLTDKFSHADFFQVQMDKKVETAVPLEFVGEAPAVKELGGVLLKGMDEIEVSCLPVDLPPKIEVDISGLKTFDDYVKIKDISFPEKVNVLVDKETVVAGVTPPRTDEDLAKLDEKVDEDVTKVEGVIKETPKAETEEETKKVS